MKTGGLKRLVESRRTELVCLALAAVTGAVYWQVSGFEFTNYDEFKMVLSNPYVLGGLTPQSIWWAMTSSWFEYWHPLTWLSHSLDCTLFGLNPGWHHLVNLGFHVANTLLLYVVLERMTGAWKRSAMVAALFALHPLHVESVAWIAERKDVLSGLFFLLTLWAYVNYVQAKGSGPFPLTPALSPEEREILRLRAGEAGTSEMVKRQVADHPLPGGEGRGEGERVQSPDLTQRRREPQRVAEGSSFLRSSAFLCVSGLRMGPACVWYWTAVAMFACGLMSKPMLVTLPFVLLLLDYWPLCRFQPCRFKVQSSALDVGSSAAPLPGLRPSGFGFRVSFSLPLLVEKAPFFALTVASCAITYLGVEAGGSVLSAKLVPWGLRLAIVPVSYVRYLGKLFWPTGLIPLYPTPNDWVGWQVAGSVAVLVLITLFAVRRARSAPYWIVGWLLFVGMLFPTVGLVRVGLQSIADRYTYLPSIGIFMAVVWAAAEWRKQGRTSNAEHPTSNAELATADDIRGPRFGVQRSAFDVPSPARTALLSAIAALVLGACGYLTWVQAGTWRNSFTLWGHCVAVCPDNFVARHNLGYALQHAGKTSEAIEQYRAALKLKPDLQDANLNLGIALMATGKSREATNYLGTVLHYSPRYARALGAMGLALLNLGDYAGAATNCGAAIQLDPDAFGPYVDMGRALSAQGKSDAALGYYAEGLRLSPGVPQIHYYLGLEYLKRGAYEQAASSFGEAVRLAPSWGEARVQQQRALEQAKQPPVLRSHAEDGQMDPGR